MEAESRSELPPAKRLKTEEGETPAAADEMSIETPAAEEGETLPVADEMSTETPAAEEGETLPAADEMSTETPAAEEGETLPAADEMSTETAAAEEGETLPAADEMSTETAAAEEGETLPAADETPAEEEEILPKLWSPSENVKPYYDWDNRTPFDQMRDAYDYLDYKLPKPLYRVVPGDPLNDKEYLFLFCKLMSDENYLKVLADKDIIYSWGKGDFRKICADYWSSSTLPESLGIAKKIVDDHNMELDMEDMCCCLKDILSDWRWRMRIRGIKEFEKFLLMFWEKNRRAPMPEEINKFRKEWYSATSAKFRAKVPILLTNGDIKEARLRGIGRLVHDGISTAKIDEQIEARYKKMLSEIFICRCHYLYLKLDKVEKSDLAKQIVEHYPDFGKLEVPRIEMDMDPLRLDEDPGSLCLY